MSNTKRDNSNILLSLWETKSGNLMSMTVDDITFDALQRVAKGGKICVNYIKPEKRKKETSPHALITFIPKDEVDAYASKREAQANVNTETF